MFLTRLSVNNPVLTVMIMASITVFGLLAWQRLPVEQMPDIDVPAVAIVVTYEGTSPETVETDIVKPIESSLSTISGIDTIRSTAEPGKATVLMQFDLNVAADEAMNDVRDKMAGLGSDLPDAASTPSILKFDPAASPVISLAISSGQRSLSDLTRLAEEGVLDQLRNVSGVGQVLLIGGVPAQVDISIDPTRLSAQGIALSKVRAAIQAEATDLPAGNITSGQVTQSIRINSDLRRVDDFRDMIVGRRGGQPVHLSDVAEISIGPAQSESLAFRNGQQALAVDVTKVQGANTIGVAERVSRMVQHLNTEILPEDVQIDILSSQADAVANSVSAVQNMLIEGAILSVVIVFLFLNSWRSTVITGLALPISMIGTMIALNLLGFTLNIMTLMALSLSVGILVDDAIVVRENITRHLETGKSHRRAALDGTAEIGLAVTATTLAIIAVFLPVAFMDGIMGRFFLQFGVTVSVAVLISLLVAFTLDPMLSSIWNDPASHPGATRGWLGRRVARLNRGLDRLTGRYLGLLRWSLRHRIATLTVAFGLFIASFTLVPLLGAEFLPAEDNGRVTVNIEALPGSSLAYTALRTRQIEATLRDWPDVQSTYTSIGAASNGTGRQSTAMIDATLAPRSERSGSAIEIAAALRPELQRHAGLTVEVNAEGDLSAGGGKPVEIVVLGPDSQALQRIGDQVAGRLADIPGVEDISSSMQQNLLEIGIDLDRDKASELGLSSRDLGTVLSMMLTGNTVATWVAEDSQSHDIVIRLDEGSRTDSGALGDLPVGLAPETGQIIRLNEIAHITQEAGPAQILRQDLSRRVSIEANLAPNAPRDVHAQISNLTTDITLPEGYRFQVGSGAQQLAESGRSAGSALVLAILCIYLVLASQFRSFLQPLAIMSSLPLSLIGALAGLWIGGSTINVMSMIGFIMLMGLVVKNAILLVDNANQRMRAGVNIYDALVAAALIRFRPILMTTVAMIMGMLPMALSLHHGSSQNAPMAHAVIGGLISSTLLTLVVVPVILTYLDALGKRARRLLPDPPPQGDAAPLASVSAGTAAAAAVSKARLAVLPQADRTAAHLPQSATNDARSDRPNQRSRAS